MKSKDKEQSFSYFLVLIVMGIALYLFSRPDILKDLVKTIAYLISGIMCFGIFMLVALFVTQLFEKIRKKPIRKTTDIQYEVDGVREKPDFDTREAYSLIVSGGVFGFIGLGICYLVIVGFINELRGTRGARDINLSAICAGLGFLPAALFYIRGMVEGIVTLIQKRNWLRETTKAQAAIVDRREITTPYGNCYEFILQATDEQGVTALDGQFIRAGVSKRIYDRYAQYDSVEIYYSTDSPLTFMIRGE